MLRFYPNIIKIFLITILLSNSFSCNKDETLVVPEVRVEYELSLTNELANLGVGMALTVTRDTNNTNFSIVDYNNVKYGKKSIAQKTYGNGILIYRSDFNVYHAYDLTCTYNAFTDYCQTKIDSKNNLMLVCPCCGSGFLIVTGCMPTNKSKAYKPLKEYSTRINGNFLKITNQ
mgnify:CR=1 FL=1